MCVREIICVLFQKYELHWRAFKITELNFFFQSLISGVDFDLDCFSVVVGVCFAVYVDTYFASFVLFVLGRVVGFVYIWEFRASGMGCAKQSLSNGPTVFQE